MTIRNWVKETTNTAGTGSLTLSAITGFPRFLDAFAADASVAYVINNGNNWESGLGTIRAGNILERTTPQVTFFNGTYNASSPSAINLTAGSTVFCDLTYAPLNKAGDTMAGALGIAQLANGIFGGFVHILSNRTYVPGGTAKNFVFDASDYIDDNGFFMEWSVGPAGDRKNYLRMNTLGTVLLAPYPSSQGFNLQGSGPVTAAYLNWNNAGNLASAIGLDINLTSSGILQDNIGIRVVTDVKNFNSIGAAISASATNGVCIRATSSVQHALLATITGTNISATVLEAIQSGTGYSGALYTASLGASALGSAAYFSGLLNGVEKFRLFGSGNLLYYGVPINGYFGAGRINNLLRRSEDLSDAVWAKTAFTVTANNTNDPFDIGAIGDTITATASFASLTQTLTWAGACAGRTFTVSGWYQAPSPSTTLQCVLRSSVDTDPSATQFFSGKSTWTYFSFTHTFAGGTAGNPRLVFSTGNNGSVYRLVMLNIVEAATPGTYVPTLDAEISNGVGVFARRSLTIWTPDSDSRLQIRIGGSQGSTNLFECMDAAGSLQLAIGPNGRDLVLDTTTGTKIGTATSQKLGFWNATPVVQQAVTGSRGGNAALADLLAKLATMGLIVDNTSA